MEFHTTEELFGALSIPEIRRVVLQSASEAESRGETLKVLVGERYSDLIGTADEAAEMFRGVQRLETRIKDLRRTSMSIFTASKPLSLVPQVEGVPRLHADDEVAQALGEWGAGTVFKSTVFAWLPSSMESIACFLDRGWPWRAACALLTAEALSVGRLHPPLLLQGSRGSVMCGARAALSRSLTTGNGVDASSRAASAFAALLLLRAQQLAWGGGRLGDAATEAATPLLTSALLNPASSVITKALDGMGRLSQGGGWQLFELGSGASPAPCTQ